jgi:hypothetical protein
VEGSDGRNPEEEVMKLPLRIGDLANDDVVETCAYYDGVDAGLGDEFYSELLRTLDSIEFMPERFGQVSSKVRAALLKRFPQIVYFTIKTTHIEVIAVVHGARDSSAWESRI